MTYINTAFFILPLFPALYSQLKNNKAESEHLRHLLGRLRRDGFVYWKSSQSSSCSRSQIARKVPGNDTYAEGLLKPDHAGDSAGTQSESDWERRSRAHSEPPVIQTDDVEEEYGDVQGYPTNDLGTEEDMDEGKFLIGETVRLSLYFCVLWVSDLHWIKPKHWTSTLTIGLVLGQ